MLRFSKNLLFPALKPQKLISFKNQNAQIRIYTLDWIAIDKIKEERWADNLNCFPPVTPFPGTLPAELGGIVNNQSYAIPDDFMQEIRLCSLKAAEEWSRQTPTFKPNLLSTSINPAISFILTAFNILSDCAYDPVTNYFSRTPIKNALPYILAYKFWAFQINHNILERYSGLKDFDFELKNLEKTDSTIHMELMKYYQSLRNHVEKLIKERVKEKVKIVEEASLNDFITNKRASTNLNDLLIKIPQIGEISLLRAKFTRSKYIYLTGEVDFQYVEKVLRAYSKGDFPIQFTCFIKTEDVTYALTLCRLETFSGNPPPIIKIKIGGFKKVPDEDSSLDNLNGTTFPIIPMSKNIDSEKIKNETDEELRNEAEFKGIRIKTIKDSLIHRTIIN
jgi:hypothetical protein